MRELFHEVRYTRDRPRLAAVTAIRLGMWLIGAPPSWIRYSASVSNWPVPSLVLRFWATGSMAGSGRARGVFWAASCIGLVGGLYNLVKESLEAMREAKREDADDAGERVIRRYARFLGLALAIVFGLCAVGWLPTRRLAGQAPARWWPVARSVCCRRRWPAGC